MAIHRNRLYPVLLASCFAGYVWLFYNLFNTHQIASTAVEVCIFKKATSIPCPSCGATRAIISITEGHFIDSLLINPLGIVVLLIMLVSPIWIIIDYASKSNTFYNTYLGIERKLKNPRIAIPCIMLIVLNWIWNISKDL